MGADDNSLLPSIDPRHLGQQEETPVNDSPSPSSSPSLLSIPEEPLQNLPIVNTEALVLSRKPGVLIKEKDEEELRVVNPRSLRSHKRKSSEFSWESAKCVLGKMPISFSEEQEKMFKKQRQEIAKLNKPDRAEKLFRDRKNRAKQKLQIMALAERHEFLEEENYALKERNNELEKSYQNLIKSYQDLLKNYSKRF